VLLVEAYPPHDWLLKAGENRRREELTGLHVTIHEAKSRIVDLATGESVGCLGFEFRRVRSRAGKWRAYDPPLLQKLNVIFRGYRRSPLIGGST
jgi:RNA-directed DNA polymerase